MLDREPQTSPGKLYWEAVSIVCHANPNGGNQTREVPGIVGSEPGTLALAERGEITYYTGQVGPERVDIIGRVGNKTRTLASIDGAKIKVGGKTVGQDAIMMIKECIYQIKSGLNQ